MLGVVDLGTGNIASLLAAINKLNVKYKICKSSFDFDGVNKLILPGVGAFKDFMDKMKKNEIDKTLNTRFQNNLPILGICVGFQVLFAKSYEFGENNGLSFIDGKVESFKVFKKDIKIPHVGWNECNIIRQNKLFDGIIDKTDFYFTHSFLVKNVEKKIILSETNYEINFVSSINYNNIYGVQFHPEKSQVSGLKLLKNYYDYC